MSREIISSSSLAGQNEFELCEKSFAHQKGLLRHQHFFSQKKMLNVIFALMSLQESISWSHIRKCTPIVSLSKSLNGNHTKLKLIYHIRKSISCKKVNLKNHIKSQFFSQTSTTRKHYLNKAATSCSTHKIGQQETDD